MRNTALLVLLAVLLTACTAQPNPATQPMAPLSGTYPAASPPETLREATADTSQQTMNLRQRQRLLRIQAALGQPIDTQLQPDKLNDVRKFLTRPPQGDVEEAYADDDYRRRRKTKIRGMAKRQVRRPLAPASSAPRPAERVADNGSSEQPSRPRRPVQARPRR